MNTDEPELLPQIKPWMEKNGLVWTQATLDSIREIIRSYRIHSYPTTLLIDPDGKVISLNQTKKGQPGGRQNFARRGPTQGRQLACALGGWAALARRKNLNLT